MTSKLFSFFDTIQKTLVLSISLSPSASASSEWCCILIPKVRLCMSWLNKWCIPLHFLDVIDPFFSIIVLHQIPCTTRVLKWSGVALHVSHMPSIHVLFSASPVPIPLLQTHPELQYDGNCESTNTQVPSVTSWICQPQHWITSSDPHRVCSVYGSVPTSLRRLFSSFALVLLLFSSS